MSSSTSPPSSSMPARLDSSSAFLAGSSSLHVPLPEVVYLHTQLPNDSLSPSDISSLLSTLKLSNSGLCSTLFSLCNTHTPSTPGHFITAYSTLRRYIFDPSPSQRAALLWLCFHAAGGNTVLSFAQWASFADLIGTNLGGPDAFPCEETIRLSRRRWRRVRGYVRQLWGNTLPFNGFVKVMDVHDAGVIEILSAVGYLLSNAVIAAAKANIEKPKWTGDADSCYLGQYLSFMIGQMEAQSDRESSEGRLVSRNTAGTIGSIDVEPRTNSNLQDGTDVSETQPNLPDFPMLDLSARGEHGSISARLTRSSPRNSGSLEDAALANTKMRAARTLRDVEMLTSSSRGIKSGSAPFQIDFSSLELGECIGSGAYGDVYKGTFLMSPVAVKVFRVNGPANFASSESKGDEDPSAMSRRMSTNALQRFASTASQTKYENFMREVEMMSLVRHPNLVLYMGACGDPVTPLCIVSELFTGGSLYEFLHSDPAFRPDLKTAISFALNIARGMFYLHSSEPAILHRDLKSRNVLLSGRKGIDGVPHVVICDFGLCQLFGEEGGGGSSAQGTASYMAPGIINGERYHAKDDVYSYGVLLHEILSGCVPFAGQRPIQVMYGVASAGKRPKSRIDGELPEALRKLMAKCWATERDARPSFEEIIHELHTFQKSMGKGCGIESDSEFS